MSNPISAVQNLDIVLQSNQRIKRKQTLIEQSSDIVLDNDTTTQNRNGLKSYKKFIPSKAKPNYRLNKNYKDNNSDSNQEDISSPHGKIGMKQQTLKKHEEHLTESEKKLNTNKEESLQKNNLKTNTSLQQTEDATCAAKRLSEFNKSSNIIWEAILNRSSIIAFQTAAQILNHNLSQVTNSDKYVQGQMRMPMDKISESILPQEKTSGISKDKYRELFHPEIDQVLECLTSDSLNLIQREKSERSPPIYQK